MKATLPSLFALAVLAAGLFYDPKPALAQSKEIVAINGLQRDIADLIRKIDESKTSQDGKSAQLETLIKQLMEANASLTVQLKSLQDSAGKSQAEQERRAYAPIERMKADVGDLFQSFNSVDLRMETLTKQQDATKKQSDEIAYVVKEILKKVEQQPVAAPDPVSAAPSPADAAAILFASAQSERLEGKPDFALAAFGDIATKYPESPFAPKAVFEAGVLYAQNEQYGEALKAFDRVLEQFPDNPMRKEAQFKKAEQLANLNKRADAAREYTNFARQYPTDDKAATARDRAKVLTAPAPAPAKTKPAAKGKR